MSSLFSSRKKLITHLAECNPEQIDDLLSEEERPSRGVNFHLSTKINILAEFRKNYIISPPRPSLPLFLQNYTFFLPSNVQIW